jgi:P27 family predicted phage terminase small subunit
MATTGRKPKPTLQVIREGNPGKRPVRDSVTLPPSALREPDWLQLLPGDGDEMVRARATAGALWKKLAPTLARAMGLVGEQQETLVDYCVTWARIEQGERALSRDGMIMYTERGNVKHPWTTVLNQYRSHLRSLIGELGLSPSSAARLQKPGGDDGEDDDPFD